MKAISDFFTNLGINPFLAGFVVGAVVVGLFRVGRVARRSEVLVDGTRPILGGTVSVASPREVTLGSSLHIEVTHNGERRVLTSAQNAAVQAALAEGNKIEAIKILREATGLGLKESKEMVDRLERD